MLPYSAVSHKSKLRPREKELLVAARARARPQALGLPTEGPSPDIRHVHTGSSIFVVVANEAASVSALVSGSAPRLLGPLYPFLGAWTRSTCADCKPVPPLQPLDLPAPQPRV